MNYLSTLIAESYRKYVVSSGNTTYMGFQDFVSKYHRSEVLCELVRSEYEDLNTTGGNIVISNVYLLFCEKGQCYIKVSFRKTHVNTYKLWNIGRAELEIVQVEKFNLIEILDSDKKKTRVRNTLTRTQKAEANAINRG